MPALREDRQDAQTNIHEDPQKQHFVKDIIEFAHDNDIITLAEGVELDVELKEVIRLGADLIQGFYTGEAFTGGDCRDR